MCYLTFQLYFPVSSFYFVGSSLAHFRLHYLSLLLSLYLFWLIAMYRNSNCFNSSVHFPITFFFNCYPPSAYHHCLIIMSLWPHKTQKHSQDQTTYSLKWSILWDLSSKIIKSHRNITFNECNSSFMASKLDVWTW